MSLSKALENYSKSVTIWLDQSKRQSTAIQKLHKAVSVGNVRDLEKLRQSARTSADTCFQVAENCEELTFDIAEYLAPNGGYLDELKQAATDSGVRLYERDGIIFCYPVLVHVEPDMAAVRIDKKLEFAIRPETLMAVLKKAQSKEPKARPERFIETLFEAYELIRSKRQLDFFIDVPLVSIYDLLTLLPGSDKDYTLLDFTRDIYFLDTSGTTETKKGFRLSLPASTVSRERSAKILSFVTRDGLEKQYASIKFTPNTRGE